MKTLRGQARQVVNDVYLYVNRCKLAFESYVAENPEKAAIFEEVFSVTGCDLSKPAEVTANMVGVCKRTVLRYHQYQMTRENLEPEFESRGRKKKELPDRCLGAIRCLSYICKV